MNKCARTIMLIINVKRFLERHFCVISINSASMNVLLCKKPVPHTTTLMKYKIAQVLHDLFNTKQRSGLEMVFMARSY